MARRPAVQRRGAHYDYADRRKVSGGARPVARGRSGAAPVSTRRVTPRRAGRSVQRVRPSSPPWGWLISLGIGLVIVVGVMSFWQVAPKWLGLKHDQNIVFLSPEKDGQSNKIYYASFRINPPSLRVWEVAGATPVTVMGGYGQYPAGAVMRLLEIDKRSPEFAHAAFSQALGVVVEDVVRAPEPPTQISKESLTKWWWAGLKTQPTAWLHWLQLYWFTQQLAAHQVEVGVGTPDQLQASLRVTPDWFDNDCSVAIVNSTNRAGLASQLSQVLETMQLQVVRVTDTNVPQPSSSLAMNQNAALCQRALRNAQALVPVKVPIVTDSTINNQYRADVVVVLGDDVTTLWSQ